MPQRSLEKLRAKRESIERRLQEGTDSADDEDDELGLQAARDKQHFRSVGAGSVGKPVLGSSKLGIEMMRANSHDSVLGSESTTEPVTQVVTPSKELETPPLDSASEMLALEMHTPPDTGFIVGDDGSGNVKMLDPAVDETPRPNPARQQQVTPEDEVTPRPSKNSSASTVVPVTE
jgi:serine/threonine-protein kinase RIM15